MSIAGIVKQAAVVTLGIIFPVAILVQAYADLHALQKSISGHLAPAEIASLFERVQPKVKSPNDYALFAQMFSENVNQTVLTHKQIIKVVVVEIGFSAISLGLMFVVLGINDGGGTGGFKLGELKVDFKTASTGALVFVVGAAMATAGGVLRNDYNGVPLPNFIGSAAAADEAQVRTEEAYKACKAGKEFAACFADLYEQIHHKEGK